MVMAVKCLMRNLLAHSRPGAKEQHFIQQSQRNSIKKKCVTKQWIGNKHAIEMFWCDVMKRSRRKRKGIVIRKDSVIRKFWDRSLWNFGCLLLIYTALRWAKLQQLIWVYGNCMEAQQMNCICCNTRDQYCRPLCHVDPVWGLH